MVDFPDKLAQTVQDELVALRASLGTLVAAKSLDRNVLFTTWNIRAFGDPTHKWTPGASGSPKRGLGHATHCDHASGRHR